MIQGEHFLKVRHTQIFAALRLSSLNPKFGHFTSKRTRALLKSEREWTFLIVQETRLGNS